MANIDIGQIAERIRGYGGPPVKLMEVCGTHTQAVFRTGIRGMLPPSIQLLSGPGCPVCVTPAGYLDRAAELSKEPDTVLCTFGDMLRVPGNFGTLLEAKAAGGDVRMLYAPMTALDWAKAEPGREFVLTAVGFETTLPVYALLVQRMREDNVKNLRLLVCAKALLPALEWICENNPDIDGFIGPGHVSAILGSDAYLALCARRRIPLAVAGFSYEHILAAIYDLLEQHKNGTAQVRNLYPGTVTKEGNPSALALIGNCFIKTGSVWRGLGGIEGSAYALKEEYREYDAGAYDTVRDASPKTGCLCGRVIIGRAQPADCPHFRKACTPMTPLGPCMVTGEGACGIWHANAANA
ncbi:MAG TPA: hydrogenase formation protein HypD [Feifaniaceae bacterium]|nr:hydrogenase formation protein HypD [Feifaniaceae bacterium]